ncbi:hypothetical protein [Roseicitreum antarcticum]|uniref:Uncharacterized protein n=1 Tax=Roseicitreum antarcticum TaxID=564137 RepID=A0A1H2R3A9_9RHOB|nr:hypothetical protein [Roseicitreum antarcticum]SDW13926.1 hypothetical protein SAMN04488238_101181 [Roseicitreum antarcticum]
MTVWGTVVAAYFVISAFAIAMTYREQRKTGGQSIVLNAVAYVACAVWPVVLAVLIYTSRRKTVA